MSRVGATILPKRIANIIPSRQFANSLIITVRIPIIIPYIIFDKFLFGDDTGSVTIKNNPKRKPPEKIAYIGFKKDSLFIKNSNVCNVANEIRVEKIDLKFATFLRIRKIPHIIIKIADVSPIEPGMKPKIKFSNL